MQRGLSWTGRSVVLAVLGLWPTVASAVPSQLNVQGVLFDESGVPVEGATTVMVRLYDAADPADAPTPLWEPAEPQDVLCEAGVFTALVPAAVAGPEADAFVAAFDAGEPRWLGIAPAGGAELAPRIPVVSVAYALVAAKAAVAEVADVAQAVDCVGCVTAGALDPAVQALFLAYDGSGSGLSATTYQAAIDELAGIVAELTAGLAPVALSGSYADLADAPDVCAEAFGCPAVQDLAARVWCLEQCDPAKLGDCRARTCDGAAETCTDAGALPDGTACGGGNGRCVGGECRGAFCGGISCPYLAGYRVACNARAHCEYTPVDAAGWREWDVWIWVPAGSFWMGRPDAEAGSADELPRHRVTIASGFFVMRYEIVVQQYLACEGEGRCTEPSTESWDGLGWGLNRSSNGRQNHPQNGLTWQQAKDFCAWAAPGGRLPSEAEWEYAASGPVHRKYPWGETPEPTCEYAVYDPDGSETRPWGCDDCTTPGCSGTLPVGSKAAGASHVGAVDMAGNVWEWCEDWWHADYDVDGGAPTDGSAWVDPASATRVNRGGGFSRVATDLRSSRRNNSTPGFRIANLGARCVRDPVP